MRQSSVITSSRRARLVRCERLFLLLLVALVPSGCGSVGLPTRGGDTGGRGQEEVIPTAIEDVLSALPRIGSGFTLFLKDPRQFTVVWMKDSAGHLTPGETLGWCLALVGILYGLYAVVFKASPFERLFSVADAGTIGSLGRKERSHPAILQVGFVRKAVSQSLDGNTMGTSTSVSLSPLPSFEFPEAQYKGLDQAQLIVLQAGVLNVVVGDVVPGALGSKGAQTLLIALYALIAVLCLQPVAAVLGAATPIRASLNFSVILFSFAFLFVAVLMFVEVVLLVDIFGIRLNKVDFSALSTRSFLLLWLGQMLWLGVIFGTLGRAFVLSFATLYGFSFWQLCFALAGGLVLSIFVTPVVFIPSFLLVLRFKELIEAIV